jgi:hypothetical protein
VKVVLAMNFIFPTQRQKLKDYDHEVFFSVQTPKLPRVRSYCNVIHVQYDILFPLPVFFRLVVQVYIYDTPLRHITTTSHELHTWMHHLCA